jgi:DUF1016 N-terminal domain
MISALPLLRTLFYGSSAHTASAKFLPDPAGASTKSQTPSATLTAAVPLAGLPAFPLPWSHYVRLLGVAHPEARHFYKAEALRGGWTVRQLDRQIGSQFYERTALSRNKTAMLRKGQVTTPDDVLNCAHSCAMNAFENSGSVPTV